FWEALEEGDASVERVARRMGLSARTLQRQLTERGGSFSTERARLLRARAEVMLKGEASIEEIAERLGYQSRRAFERAFTRWTGRSPAASRG
ncbi:MAG: helix-turn-helix domain-containing protein, partial [Sandaracinaceae bacterium]